MPAPPFPDAVRRLLATPNPAVMATLRRDGQPVTVATWYLLEDDGRILVNMDEGRKRLDHIRADPRVSLTVLSSDSWYTHVSLQGQVVELTPDPGHTDIDRLSSHYTGHPYPDHERGRVSARVQVQRWHGWGALREQPDGR